MTASADERVLIERDHETGIARITLNNPERRNSYDPPMREQLGAYLDELAIDDDIKVVLLRGRGRRLQHRRRHGQRVRLVRRQAASGPDERPAPSPATEPAATALGRPQDVRLLPRLPRLPEGHRRRGAGLRARRRLRAGAHGRHRRRRARHQDRHAGHPLPRPRARLAPHVLPPPRPGAGPAAAAHRRHDRRRCRSSISASSPRSSTTTTVEARADWWAEKVARMPADGIVIAKEAFRLVEQLQALPGRGGAQLPLPRLRHEPAVRRRASSTSSRRGPSTAPSRPSTCATSTSTSPSRSEAPHIPRAIQYLLLL